MAIITKSELNRIVGHTTIKSQPGNVRFAETDSTKTYDVFLSHSYLDRETIAQVNDLLEKNFGLDVYVDWIENPELDRTEVTPATAAQLRNAMDRSKTLVYAVSAKAASSKWMPWELGYSDARHGRVAVLPIAEHSSTYAAYSSQEFVGLYPYVDLEKKQGDDKHLFLWVNDPLNPRLYDMFHSWLRTGRLSAHNT